LSGLAAGDRTDSKQILQQRRRLFKIGLSLVEKTPVKSIDIRDTTNALDPKHFGTDLDADLDPKPALFVSDLKMPTKNKILCLFTSFFKDKVIKKSQKSRNNRFFFIFLLFDGRICFRSWIPTNKLQIRMRILIQKAQKHTDPTDPEL
jgi:hypothetical protein